MREKNETPLAVCTVAIYADSDKLEAPTGSGSDADSFATQISDSLKSHLEENNPNIAEQFENWIKVISGTRLLP